MFTYAKCALATTLVLAVSSASADSVSVDLSAQVTGVCQVQDLTPTRLVLLCGQGFTPASPLELLNVAASVPAANWQFKQASLAPQGGTLNEYVLSAPSGNETLILSFY